MNQPLHNVAEQILISASEENMKEFCKKTDHGRRLK